VTRGSVAVWLKRYWILVTPLMVSSSAWLITLAILKNTSEADLEGALYLCAFIGTLSFALTGPIAAIFLSILIHRGHLAPRFLAFSGILILIALPILSFEGVGWSVSVMELFWPKALALWSGSDLLLVLRLSSTAVVIYAAYAIILYPLAKRSLAAVSVGAALLSAATLTLIVYRFLHS